MSTYTVARQDHTGRVSTLEDVPRSSTVEEALSRMETARAANVPTLLNPCPAFYVQRWSADGSFTGTLSIGVQGEHRF